MAKRRGFEGDPKAVLKQLRSEEFAEDVDLPGIDFSGMDLGGVCGRNGNLAGADLSGCKLHGFGMIQSDLSGANLNKARCKDFAVNNTNFTKANLSGATIVDGALNGTNFTAAQCVGIRIEGTPAIAVIFARANLTGAKLTNVGLSRGDFRNATLKGATFEECEFRRADFSGADLTNASFKDADLHGANLATVKFAGTKFKGSRYDEMTKWPGGETPAGAVWDGKKKPKAASKSAKPGAPTPKLLGSVSSLNASLQMVIADAPVARAYRGIDNGKGDELEGSDWDATIKALRGKVDCTLRRIGDGQSLALDLRVGQGVARVYRVDGGLIVVESYADEELTSIASPERRKGAKAVGKLKVTSGTLVLATCTENCEKAPTKLALGKAREFGSDSGSLAIGLEPGTYCLYLEKRDDSERCAHLVREG